jgi:drug/metabolite transporter (DMT)-like permease
MSSSQKAIISLLQVTLIWGLTFPLIRLSVQHISPFSFVFFRFILSACILFPFVIKELKQTSYNLLLSAFLLGLFNFISYSSQCMGLKFIPANESAFITSTAVIFVPTLMWLFKIGTPGLIDYACSLLCLVGLFILTGASIHELSFGEFITIVTAFSFAIYIILMERITLKKPNYKLLTFYQIIFISLFSAPFATMQMTHEIFTSNVIMSLLFCAIFATVLVLYLQTKYQQYVAATKVALIFCVEPVWASIFAFMINHEPITRELFIGGLIILASICLPDVWRMVRYKPLAYARGSD